MCVVHFCKSFPLFFHLLFKQSEKSVNLTILENMDVRFASKKVIRFLKGNKEKIIANSNIFTVAMMKLFSIMHDGGTI